MYGPAIPDFAEARHRLSVSVCDPDDVPALDTAANWSYSTLSLAPDSLRRTGNDRRWRTTWVLARAGDRIVGVTATYQPRNPTVSDPIYDPRSLAPDLFSDAPASAREWLYVGGFNNMVAGATVAGDLSAAQQAEVRTALISHAFADGDRRGLYPFALYVRDEEIDAFRTALGERAATEAVTGDAVIDLPYSTGDGYLAALDRKRRNRVRREWEQLDARQLRAVELPASEAVEEAAPLIVAVKHRNNVADHPRIAKLRLGQWASGHDGDRRALTVRDTDGTLLGVSFIARARGRTEVNELGLVDESPLRHLAYTELLVYAPLRHALRHGCRQLSLGLGSPAPKTLRGARTEPVWAVARR